MLQTFRRLYFRPSSQPGIRLPVTARSCGHYALHAHTEANVPRPFSQIFWIHSGTLLCTLRGRRHHAHAGDVFHYPANEPHRIDADATGVEYFWATFDGALVGQWLATSGIDRAPRHAGPCPTDLFAQLRDALTHADTESELRAAQIGLALLQRFAGRTTQPPAPPASPLDPSLATAARAALDAHFADPRFGIETAAATLGCHRSTLFRVFREAHGITPSEYLQRLRVRRALEMLRSTRLSIAEIAPASGFADPNYLAKVIRRATGEPPSRIRRFE